MLTQLLLAAAAAATPIDDLRFHARPTWLHNDGARRPGGCLGRLGLALLVPSRGRRQQSNAANIVEDGRRLSRSSGRNAQARRFGAWALGGDRWAPKCGPGVVFVTSWPLLDGKLRETRIWRGNKTDWCDAVVFVGGGAVFTVPSRCLFLRGVGS